MVMLFYMLKFVLVHDLVIFLPKAAAFIAKYSRNRCLGCVVSKGGIQICNVYMYDMGTDSKVTSRVANKK